MIFQLFALSGLVSANEVLEGIKGGFKTLPTCKPVSRTADSIGQLSSQGILQSTKVGAVASVFESTKWGWASDFKQNTGSFGRGATPLEKANTGGDGGHEGVDQPLGRGSELLAIADGRIAYVLTSCVEGDTFCGNAWGNQIVVDHGNSRFARYAHISASKVKLWQTVKKGDTIALSGSTGLSDGPHLHLEIGHKLKKSDGKAVSNFYVLGGQDIVDPCAPPPVFQTVYDFEKLPW